MRIRYEHLTATAAAKGGKDFDRKAYLIACEAAGYKKSTANRQMSFSDEYITDRFGK